MHPPRRFHAGSPGGGPSRAGGRQWPQSRKVGRHGGDDGPPCGRSARAVRQKLSLARHAAYLARTFPRRLMFLFCSRTPQSQSVAWLYLVGLDSWRVETNSVAKEKIQPSLIIRSPDRPTI